MNSKGIVVISVIVIFVVGITYLSSTTQFKNSMTPSIQSDLSVEDSSSLDLNYSDDPEVSSSNSIEGNTSYTVDEDGKKQYSIEVGDAPSIQE